MFCSVDKYSFSDALTFPSIFNAFNNVHSVVNNLQIDSSMLTIHNALLSAYIDSFSSLSTQPINLLEIGTYDGVNSRILCELHSKLLIKTFDVDPMNPLLTNVYPDGQSLATLKRHYKKRLASCCHPRITYEEKSSTFLFNKSSEYSSFSIFWVDGDHTYPQVTIDILNCLSASLPNDTAVILLDDVYLDSADPTFSTVTNICSVSNLYSLQWFQKRSLGDKGVMCILRSNSPSILLN